MEKRGKKKEEKWTKNGKTFLAQLATHSGCLPSALLRSLAVHSQALSSFYFNPLYPLLLLKIDRSFPPIPRSSFFEGPEQMDARIELPRWLLDDLL